MTRVLIAYGTSEGHTAKIAEFIAGVIREHGHQADPVNVGRATPDPRAYDAVIVGGSIHKGKHQTCVAEYVRETREQLERLPTAFFSASLVLASGTEKGRKDAWECAEEFFRLTQWRPSRVELVAGALLYTQYNFLVRWIMKRIARSYGSQDLDTSRDYVYTDWRAVRRFAEEFLEAAVPARLAAHGVMG